MRSSNSTARLDQLCWMIAQLSAARGWCPRGPLRVMYADLIAGSAHDNIHGTASAGKLSSNLLGEDLRTLDKLGIIERRDVRVIVVDWRRLNVMAHLPGDR